MRLLSMILRLLGRLLRSFIILLSIIFIGIPLGILMLIIPPLRRKIESLNQSSASRFVDQSSQGVTLDIEIPNQQDYLNFLMETWQKISENPNPQLIYPFWAQNLDKLDYNLAPILDSGVREKLTQVTPEQAYSIAIVIFYFSNLIQEFPLGDIAANKEIAITGYEIALNIFTFEVFPQEWAGTQNNLANAYSDRIRGEKAENLDRAIAFYNEALKVYTFDAFPQDWATTQNNLAIAYSNRIRGEKAENLDRAIITYNEALKVRTFDAFPQDWAATQNNLANAYSDRIRGEKAENLERAIITYNEALKVRTFEAFPEDWAGTQNNLANAYINRIRGEKAENLERAITAYHEALKVYTFDAFPQKWALTQNNLAVAYSDRIRG
jgi:tetratricopeptide (TPR) repeat protein